MMRALASEASVQRARPYDARAGKRSERGTRRGSVMRARAALASEAIAPRGDRI
jgi:hypothetical protein